MQTGFPNCCQAGIIHDLYPGMKIPKAARRVELAISAKGQKVDGLLRKAGFRPFATSKDEMGRQENLTFWVRGDASLKLAADVYKRKAATKKKRERKEV